MRVLRGIPQTRRATNEETTHRVGQTVYYTTTNGVMDQSAIVSDLEAKYEGGDLWIWTVLGETEYEGIIIKSDENKIY